MAHLNRCDQSEASPGADELVRLLAHDARTPLNAVHGFAELLLAGAGGPLSEAALGHLMEIARAGRAIEAALGLAQQLAELDAAAMRRDRRKVDLAWLLTETGFALARPAAGQGPSPIAVPESAWRAALTLCRGHLAGGAPSGPAPLAELGGHGGGTLDLTLHAADIHDDRPLSVLAEKLLAMLLGAGLRSRPPHRPMIMGLPMTDAQRGGRVEASRQR